MTSIVLLMVATSSIISTFAVNWIEQENATRVGRA
jgi:hypothetical protein